jgi:hypothetical protein
VLGRAQTLLPTLPHALVFTRPVASLPHVFIAQPPAVQTNPNPNPNYNPRAYLTPIANCSRSREDTSTPPVYTVGGHRGVGQGLGGSLKPPGTQSAQPSH